MVDFKLSFMRIKERREAVTIAKIVTASIFSQLIDRL